MSQDNIFNDSEELGKDWQKVSRDLTKIGLSDGISDGRESNFQLNFDKGYAEGFQNAFMIGQYKAATLSHNNIQDPLLETPERGYCEICEDPNLLNSDRSITDVISQQRVATNQNLEQLKSKYGVNLKNK